MICSQPFSVHPTVIRNALIGNLFDGHRLKMPSIDVSGRKSKSESLDMPVSYLPLVTWILLLGVPMLCRFKGRKASLAAAVVSTVAFSAIVLTVYVPGWILMAKAQGGAPEVQYDLARWTENHCWQINQILLWPCQSDVLGGFGWLEKAAAQDYPPALYVVGVRLKYGLHVPRPANWRGPGGNSFPQPERGQRYIDRALELGFNPSMREDWYYDQVFRR